MAVLLRQRWCVSEGDQDTGSISYVDILDEGELLQGTPTVTEVGTSDLSLQNPRISTTELTILGERVPPGMAVQFEFAGQLEGVTYRVRVKALTATGREFVRDQTIKAS